MDYFELINITQQHYQDPSLQKFDDFGKVPQKLWHYGPWHYSRVIFTYFISTCKIGSVCRQSNPLHDLAFSSLHLSFVTNLAEYFLKVS